MRPPQGRNPGRDRGPSLPSVAWKRFLFLEKGEPGLNTLAWGGHTEAKNRLSDYKHVEADEKELEKEEAESEKDEPGEYQAMEVVDEKHSLTRRKKKKAAKRSG